MRSTQPVNPKPKFDVFWYKSKKPAVKYSVEKPIVLNFANLSTAFVRDFTFVQYFYISICSIFLFNNSLLIH